MFLVNYFLCTRNEEDQILDGVWICNATIWNEEEQKPIHCTYSTSRVHNMERHSNTGKHHDWRKNNIVEDDSESDKSNKNNEKQVDNKSIEEKILLSELVDNTDALSMMFSRIRLNNGIPKLTFPDYPILDLLHFSNINRKKPKNIMTNISIKPKVSLFHLY